jgi:hypothetical protein
VTGLTHISTHVALDVPINFSSSLVGTHELFAFTSCKLHVAHMHYCSHYSVRSSYQLTFTAVVQLLVSLNLFLSQIQFYCLLRHCKRILECSAAFCEFLFSCLGPPFQTAAAFTLLSCST